MIKTCICTIFRSKSDIFCGLLFVCFCFGFPPQVKGIENWVSASGIIQMEAPVFCSSWREGLWDEKIPCRQCRRLIDPTGHWLFWRIRRLLDLSKIEVMTLL